MYSHEIELEKPVGVWNRESIFFWDIKPASISWKISKFTRDNEAMFELDLFSSNFPKKFITIKLERYFRENPLSITFEMFVICTNTEYNHVSDVDICKEYRLPPSLICEELIDDKYDKGRSYKFFWNEIISLLKLSCYQFSKGSKIITDEMYMIMFNSLWNPYIKYIEDKLSIATTCKGGLIKC